MANHPANIVCALVIRDNAKLKKLIFNERRRILKKSHKIMTAGRDVYLHF